MIAEPTGGAANALAPRRNVVLLALCQALFMTGTSMVLTTTALVGLALAEDKTLATLPLGLQFLMTTATTLPAAFIMKRFGRRTGFLIGVAAGAASGVLSTYAIVHGHFGWFTVGGMLLGVYNSFAQYYRFAAAESAAAQFRSQAISLVLAGGVLAAVAGPNLARFSKDLIDAAPFAGSYAGLVLLQLAVGALLMFIRIPRLSAQERREPGRPLAAIARQPVFWVAVLAGMIGYATMSLLMTSTPLAMHAHGHGFSDTAFVIEWHMLGMFVPAFFTGRLIRRYGALNVIAAGAGFTLLGVAVNLTDTTVANFWTALAAVGVGWNFMYIGATTLLTESYTASESAKAQGVNELFIWGTVSIASLSSGALQHLWGWSVVNAAVIPLLLLSLAATTWLRFRRPRASATGVL